MRKNIIYDGQETNYEIEDNGKIYNKKFGRELKGTYTTNEYQSVQLSINGKLKTFLVHRLVATNFCDNPNNYNIVDHINRNKHDNRAENLRWVSSHQNALNVEKNNKNKKDIKYIDVNQLDESWKEIYCSSNYLINKETSEIISKKTGRILAQQDRHGYKRINLNGQTKSVHIIMWKTFNGDILNNYEIDHIDGNRSNNKLSNLRQVNHSENMKNSYYNGHKNTVKIYQFDLNGQLIAQYNSIQEAANTVNQLHAAIKDASVRLGTCGGYYWLRESDKDNINNIINAWIPEGYKIIPSYPTYCINKDKKIFNKRNKKICSTYFLKNGITEMIQIQGKRLQVEKLYDEAFSS